MVDNNLLEYLSNFISEERNQKFDRILKERTRHFTVAIEDVYQLHNTSAVIRSCDVFGIQEVNIIEERNTKKIDREIAMGAQKWVDINRFSSAKECITSMKNNGYRIVATSPHANDIELNDFKIDEKACFFLGSERDGISEEVKEAADCFLRIPMFGFTESLNISVSAAIILQQAMSLLRSSEIEYVLSEDEKSILKNRWIKRTLKSYDQIVSRYRPND
ncbi:tRNA (guanosine-2'-O-)-methyltransferase [Flavobacteriaceae bacterium MAR_2010_188]|nr:tRNA (guanosine-2'-O-)-methyltransferase [Flavobacteriaceae bacterium MAR_2010_188]